MVGYSDIIQLKGRVTIMDEKMKEAMKNIYDDLTDGQKEKWNACKTEEELIQFISNEGIGLPDELADAIAGGIYLRPANPIGYREVV